MSTTSLLLTEYRNWKFEDRIAALLMATIYTTDHLDVAMLIKSDPKVALTPKNRQLAIGSAMDSQAQSLKVEKRKTDYLEALQKQVELNKQKKDRVEMTVPPNFVYRVHDMEPTVFPPKLDEFGKPVTRIVDGKEVMVTKAVDFKVKKLAGDVSEIDFDTVAVIIVNSILYVSYNYKVRYTIEKPQMRKFGKMEVVKWSENVIDYRTFGDVSQATFKNAMTALKNELKLKKKDESEKDIKRVVFVGVDKDKFNKQSLGSFVPNKDLGEELGKLLDTNINAAPHAEMQLRSYLSTKKDVSLGKEKLYVGVSKPCCSRCAENLKNQGVGFRTEENNAVKNWLLPEHITTKEAYAENI